MLSYQRESAKDLNATQFDAEKAVVAKNAGTKIMMEWMDGEDDVSMKKYSYLLATRPGRTRWPKAELTASAPCYRKAYRRQAGELRLYGPPLFVNLPCEPSV